MTGYRNRFTWGLALVLGLAVMVAGCHRDSDEVQVRAAIVATVEAVEANAAGGVGKTLSADFDGNAGELDLDRVQAMLRVFRLRHEKIGVTLGPVAVERRGERLVASFTATLTGGGRLLPDHLGVYQVETGWRLEDGDWRCYVASWKPRFQGPE